MGRTIVGFDAGFTHLGIMVAELPSTLRQKPRPVHLQTAEAPPSPTKAERAAGVSITLRSIERIQAQAGVIAQIHNDFDPVAYFVEMPSGGGKSAAATRGMAYSIAYVSTALYLLAWDRVLVYFSPQEVKRATIGWHEGSKLEVAEAVFKYWPGVTNWPGFKVIHKRGKQDKALGHDATDAGAVIITATGSSVYRALVRSGKRTR